MKKHQNKLLFNAMLNSVSALILFVIITQSIYFLSMPLDSSEHVTAIPEEHIVAIVSLAVMPLVYFSIIRTINIFDRKAQEQFINENYSLSNLSCIFKKYPFWTDIVVFSLIYFIFPLNWFSFAFNYFFADFSKMTAFCIILPLTALLNFLARVSVIRYWQANKNPNYSEKENNSAFQKQLIKVAAIYILGGMLLSKTAPVIINYLPILKKLLLPVLYVILFIVLVRITCKFVLFFIKRRKFLKKLSSVCTKNGFKICKIHHPYRSLFKSTAKENITVSANSKIYSCKFIPARFFEAPLVFCSADIAYYDCSIRFLRIKLFGYKKQFNYNFETEGTKILILNPAAKDVYTEDTTRTAADNGERIAECNIFTGTAFLNAIERNSIGEHK